MSFFGKFASWFKARPSTAITVRTVASEGDSVRGPMITGNTGRVWELPDRDFAMREAEVGEMKRIADLCDAMRGDGLIRGILGTRSAGQWSLPTLFSGDPWVCEVLRGAPAEYDPASGAIVKPRIVPMWERLMPLAEAAAIVEDGVMAGVGVGYMEDDPFPGGWRRLRRLDLQWLRYQHATDEWFYHDAKRGRLRVTPGDGRWVLFTPYGRSRPWARGAWFPCAGPFISKQGAVIDRTRWSKFLADGLRYIESNEDASEVHLNAMRDFIWRGWGYAPGVALPKGYKPGIEESSGKGYEVYADTEERADREIQVALAGQVVTVDGSAGFSSGDVWRDLAASVIGMQAKAGAEWCCGEVLDPWTSAIGLGAGIVSVAWDTRSPSQRTEAIDAAKAAAESVKALDDLVKERGQRVKLAPFLDAHGVDVELEDVAPPAGPPQLPGPAPQLAALPVPGGAAGLLPAPAVAAAEDEPEDDSAARLAQAMTEHGVDRCEHESLNRCRICGIERERVLVPGKGGAPHGWKVAWRPIARPKPPSADAAVIPAVPGTV